MPAAGGASRVGGVRTYEAAFSSPLLVKHAALVLHRKKHVQDHGF
jgi:hypothetical protein